MSLRNKRAWRVARDVGIPKSSRFLQSMAFLPSVCEACCPTRDPPLAYPGAVAVLTSSHRLTFLWGNCPYLPWAPRCPGSRRQTRPRDPGPAHESPGFQGAWRQAPGLARFGGGPFGGSGRQCWEFSRDHLKRPFSPHLARGPWSPWRPW